MRRTCRTDAHIAARARVVYQSLGAPRAEPGRRDRATGRPATSSLTYQRPADLGPQRAARSVANLRCAGQRPGTRRPDTSRAPVTCATLSIDTDNLSVRQSGARGVGGLCSGLGTPGASRLPRLCCCPSLVTATCVEMWSQVGGCARCVEVYDMDAKTHRLTQRDNAPRQVSLSDLERRARDAWRTVTRDEVLGALAELRRVRALPVIATCHACPWVGPTSGGWSCDHDTSIERTGGPQGPRVDPDAAPPSWCPMRAR